MSSIINNVLNASDLDDEQYEEELVHHRQEADCKGTYATTA